MLFKKKKHEVILERVVKHVYENRCCESTVLQVVLEGNF
jgi:hypothetical protein